MEELINPEVVVLGCAGVDTCGARTLTSAARLS